VGQRGPGCLKGAAPRFGGELHEVLAEPGDCVLFHSLMGHSGSVNVAAPHTRHALLNRYHPTRRLEPLASDEDMMSMSTLERANSARFLSEAFGVGRCLRPSAPPAPLTLPWVPTSASQHHPRPPLPPPPTTAFYLYGVFQLWSAVPGETAARRWFSYDLTQWHCAPDWQLPPAAHLPLMSLAFHHYELEAVLAVTDAKGVCWLFESESSAGASAGAAGGIWNPMPPGCHTVAVQNLQCVVPFNAYAGYPSTCAVGQCLYHTFSARPTELRCR
jgi:hypothetical protein